MLYSKFKSDQIDLVVDHYADPKELSVWIKRNATNFSYRLCFSINQHYPELNSGFYRNRRLEAIVHESLISKGVHVVIEDNFDAGGITPTEMAGSLETSDDYLLVDTNMKLRGRLIVWQSSGGKNPLYHDRLMMDFISDDPDLLEDLKKSVSSML